MTDPDRPETPRSEPEIIAPGDMRDRDRLGADEWTFTRGSQRIYVKRISPFSMILWLLAIGIVGALLFVLFIGAVLFVVPIVALGVAGALAYMLLRARFFRRR